MNGVADLNNPVKYKVKGKSKSLNFKLKGLKGNEIGSVS